MTDAIRVELAGDGDAAWLAATLEDGGWTQVARRGTLVRPLDHPSLVARRDGSRCGLLTVVDDGVELEILVLLATERRSGVGTALVEAAASLARQHGRPRLNVMTTNDNVDALRFYQRRGFRIREVRPGAVDEARAHLKPGIPAVGDHGIPLRDEIDLVREVTPAD